MATILSKEACIKIKEIREEIAELGASDWMCEGADDHCNAFFSNTTEGYCLADYSGNITVNNGAVITPDLRKLAKLEGEISQIVLEEELRTPSGTEDLEM